MRVSHRPYKVQFDSYLIIFLPASKTVFRIKEQFEEQGRIKIPGFPETGQEVTSL